MRVKTSKTAGGWVEAKQPFTHGEGKFDPANEEVGRHLSQAVRSPHLIVLAGLGTSLCVVRDGTTLAPTMQALSDAVKAAFQAVDSEKGEGNRWLRFKKLANVTDAQPDLELLLSRAKVATEILNGGEAKEVEQLLQVAEEAIRTKVDFLQDDLVLDIHQAFLRRIARRSTRLSRIKLFTTNYDRCFEVASQQSGFVVVDGFAFGSDATFQSEQFGFDVVRRSDDQEQSDFIPNLFHLYKMHGSIDWEADTEGGQVRKVKGTKKPLLIYPRSTKYEMAFSHPYIEMMGGFQASVRRANTTLLCVGFGFNDKHIAEPIIAAMRSNLALNLVVVDPSIEARCGARSANSYLRDLNDLIGGGDGRIALIEAKFEDLIPFIPDVVAETELEQHLERVRLIGASRGTTG